MIKGQDVKCLMEKAGFENVTVKKDLAGLDRVVFGVYNIAEGEHIEKGIYNKKMLPAMRADENMEEWTCLIN